MRHMLIKMRLYRTAILIIMMVLLSMFLVSCGQEKSFSASSVEELNTDKVTIGVVSGYIFGDSVSKNLPNAQLKYYDDRESAYMALNTGEIQVVADDEPIQRAIIRSEKYIKILDGYVEESDYSFIFSKDEKGQKLCEEYSAYVKGLKDSGKLAEIDEKWFGEAIDNKSSEDYLGLPSDNGTLHIAFDSTTIPFGYLSANRPVGYDIDIAIGFCKEYGYGLELENVAFTDMLEGVAAGKYDAGCGAITITDERAKNLNFGEPDYEGGISTCIKIPDDTGKKAGFMSRMQDHIGKTFVDEDRYMIFLKGIGITLLLVVIAIIFGTPLGIIFYITDKHGKRVASVISRIIMSLLHGTPVVMLIMLLYYGFFYTMSIGGLVASTIAFILYFTESVYQIIKRNAEEVEEGRLVDAYHLWYIETESFFINLFQARGEKVNVDYREAVINLIKFTSVVGIVSVNDMTKVVDIIRQDSLEAICPIVFTMIVYFLLIWIITIIIKPKARKAKKVDIVEEIVAEEERREEERRKGDRRQGDRRKGDRRKGDRRQGERRTEEDRRTEEERRNEEQGNE